MRLPNGSLLVYDVFLVDLVVTVYFGGLIPSQDLDTEEYYFYLKYASPDELEDDLITRTTVNKMSLELGHDFSKRLRNRVSNNWETHLNFNYRILL